jgi:hypothetical protein
MPIKTAGTPALRRDFSKHRNHFDPDEQIPVGTAWLGALKELLATVPLAGRSHLGKYCLAEVLS